MDSKIKRIVSLVPSITEILFFLGLGEKIIGVTEHCNYPEEVKNRNKVGTFGRPSLCKIIGLNPQIVFADRILHKKIAEELQNAGIKVFDFTPLKVNDIFSFMEKVLKICGCHTGATKRIDSLQGKLHNLSSQRSEKQPRVFRLMSSNPPVIPGPASFQYDALRIAGARLMEVESNSAYVSVTLEQIREFDPEIILFCGVAKGEKLPPRCKGCVSKKPICQRTADDIFTGEWGEITAVRNNKLYPIPCYLICRPGPRMIDGIEKIQKLLVPIGTKREVK